VGLLVGAGIILVATGLLIVVGDHDDMHRKMPFQVLPRRLAAIPIGIGATLLAIAAMVALLP
jgi:multisubunit Na+/H+ antiporter MnhB subunit